MGIAENLKRINGDILRSAEKTGRKAKLVAVTKGVNPEKIRQAAEAGQFVFGENYVQEALAKIDALSDIKEIEWHFIGHLQSKKAKYCVDKFSMVHSVDRVKVAVALDREACKKGISGFPVLIEVNIAGEESKNGADPSELTGLIKEISTLKGISIKGLMAMPPFFDNPEGSRKHFRSLKEMAREINDMDGRIELSELSIGLSHDYKIALEEGATMIRVGTAIFGKRSA